MDQLHLAEQNKNLSKNMPLQEKSMSSPSFNFSVEKPMPKPPVMTLGTPATAAISNTHVFQTAQKIVGGVTPNQLQFDTPNLTPILTVQDHSFVAQNSSTDFVDLTNPHTVRRAKQVAARLYYEPTPETPNSSRRDSSKYLRGRSVLFADNINETPLRRGGRPSELSTARKPRALFLSSENKQIQNSKEPEDENVDFSHHEDHQTPEVNQNKSGDDKQMIETPGLLKENAIEEDVVIKEEEVIMNHHNNVEQILELFCLLGAGYWRLCQVRFLSCHTEHY
jgi:hypothetical protein